MAYQEYKVGKTIYAYDQSTGAGIAFPNMESFTKFFGRQPSANIPDLPVDPAIFNSAPGTLVQGPKSTQARQEEKTSSLSYFFTPEQIAAIPAELQTPLAIFADVQQKNFESGKVDLDIGAEMFNKALENAKSDPAIVAKYGDELNVAQEDLKRSIDVLKGEYTQETASQQRQFKQQDKDLAEAEAAAGRAMSGFRRQAEDRLKAEQGDIITSTRRALKQNVERLGSGYEQRFGTPALQKVGAPTVEDTSYTPYGNIKGTYDTSKEADVRNRALETFEVTQ